ncbi:hypothetical protein BZA05DRAFT_383323 [Tricharina praecox]|uniref:uncharacterized protein n=1 Tax=Tricharina praecox TaxID=43433 RepID=UPI002220E594|nr:uncharacterized protein BZA05DRAFT_383323 [Tricharina praecox]KAI5859095.1 hypothetical protein BZA05DRAFT_383323 [Tricharina praecox]
MMFSKATLISVLLAAAASVNGHMHMSNPPALGASENKFTAAVDVNIDAPLASDGSDFPCRGHLNLIGTAAGASVADYTAGSTQSITVAGGARHNGGSCQVSLSEDGGSSWKVMKTFIGDCPAAGAPLGFTVPAEAKSGEAILAWSWFNQVGNREMYMNCAAVTISGGGSGLSALPDMFVANAGNGCTSNAEGTGDLEIPNPGEDVERKSTKSSPPVGSCASGGSPAPPADDSSSADAPTATAPAETATEPSPTSVVPTFIIPTPEPTIPADSPTAPVETAPAETAPAATNTFNDGLYRPTGGAKTFDDGLYHPKATAAPTRVAYRFRA